MVIVKTDKTKPKVGRPLKYETPEQMQIDIDAYFDSCWEEGENGKRQTKPYTMSGLANSLGMCRKTLLNYSNKDEFLHTLKRAREKVHQYVEEYLFTGKNTTGAIFNLKNNFAWKDQQDHKVDLSDPLTTLLDKIASQGPPKPSSDDSNQP